MTSLLVCLVCVNIPPQIVELERTLDAICQVESSGGRDLRDGDGGRAIGPFQIHRDYWQDGTRLLGVRWPYSDARDPGKARQVVRAYVTAYAKAGGFPATPEVWAKLHNGGPQGPRKTSTRVYWAKVQARMVEKPISGSIHRNPDSQDRLQATIAPQSVP